MKLNRINETADRLCIGRSRVYELIARGELTSVKIGGSRRISDRAIDEYIAKLEADAKASA